MTRLGCILHFRIKYSHLSRCVIIAEHRGSYTAVPVGSEGDHHPNHTYKEICVRRFLREHLRLQHYPEEYVRYVSRKAPTCRECSRGRHGNIYT